MVLNVADLVEHAVDLVPERTAVVCGDRRVTYSELEARTNQLAHHLAAQGVGPGDHVGVYAANALETLEAMLAITKLRAVAINVNYRYTEAELKYVVENADCVALVHQRGLSSRVAAVRSELPLLRHVVVFEDGSDDGGAAEGYGAVGYDAALAAQSPERDFAPRDPGDLYMLYTGGTTGPPKGVMWRQEDVWRTLGGGVDFMTGEPVADEWDQARAGVDSPVTRLVVAPLIHGQAQWATLGGLFAGSTMVILPKFDAHAIWRAVEQEKVNVMAIVGDAMARPMIEAFHEGDYDASSVFYISSTAALMSTAVKEQYLEAFPNAFLSDAVGSSETGFTGIGIVSKDGMSPQGPRVNPNKDAIVIDDEGRRLEPGSGVIGRLARGGYLPLGYYKDPEKTAKLFAEVDGKRYTVPGDFALHDADGTIVLLGRGNTCVNTGGEKVFPEEVEAVLKSHPGVFDCLVVPVPDERMGQRVAAVVQWREGHQADADDLDRHIRLTLAGYKVPRSYWWADGIGRLATGKPDYGWARKQTEDRRPDVEWSTSPVAADADAPAAVAAPDQA
jgi:acyl-CoA synthetase (AMP-forming)/AMP-acid ligase II